MGATLLSSTDIAPDILDYQCTAVVLLDQDLRIRYLNTAGELLFARSGNRVDGVAISELLGPESEVPDFSGLSEAGNTLTQREAKWSLNPELDATTVDYMATRIVRDNQPWVLMEIQPIDRLKKISRDEELMAKQETTKFLVRGMAHEIKNPLGGIRGAAQLLARELPNDQLQDYTSVIIEEADRLTNLVDRMLGSSKLPDRIETNIHEVLERVHSLVSAEIAQAENGVKLQRDYDPSLPDIIVDPEQIIQAVLNVVRNAVQALTESNTGDPNIRLKTRVARQVTIGHNTYRLVCRLDIIDNGPGIPADIVENIFYPMISGRAGGTGLGLSIAQQIVGQHGGIIECDGRPGNTRFSLFIPLGDIE